MHGMCACEDRGGHEVSCLLLFALSLASSLNPELFQRSQQAPATLLSLSTPMLEL